MKRGAPSTSGNETYAPKHAPKPRGGKGASSRAPGPSDATGKKGSASGPKKRSFLRRRWWLFVLVTPLVLFAFVARALQGRAKRIAKVERVPVGAGR